MSLWYCATCTLLVKSAVDRPYCSICRQRILAKDTHLVIPRAELEELVGAAEWSNQAMDAWHYDEALLDHARQTAAKFRAKFLKP